MMMKNEEVLGGSYGKMGARHRAPGGSDCSFEMEFRALIKTMEDFINCYKCAQIKTSTHSFSSVFRYCLTIRLDWVVIDP